MGRPAITSQAHTIRSLLDGATYTVDVYQREYAWQERQVRELVNDLTGRFLGAHDAEHPREEVMQYGHYFLGSIVISRKQDRRFVVDGQQRLTTLTLLLIYLTHAQLDRDDVVDLSNLIFVDDNGRKSFNLDVPERRDALEELLLREQMSTDNKSQSVQNMVNRYANIADYFPEEAKGAALAYFVDWLLNNVHLVTIEAHSDEDAYAIFETMNDRGLPLSLPDLLKGYILAKITHEQDQLDVDVAWKRQMQALKSVGRNEETEFFKNWLRARHAMTFRSSSKGSENQDYERIGSEFHRWIRDNCEQIGLTTSHEFVRFVKHDLTFYATQAVRIREAATSLTPGLESIYYNEDRGFTLQDQLILAALHPDDASDVVTAKMALIADYLDIWLARRAWASRTIAHASVRYTLFQLTKEVRDLELPALSLLLLERLESEATTFANAPHIRLHKGNYRQIRHILARLSHWVDERCGKPTHFHDLVSKGSARPFEIEHIWANHHERFADVLPNEIEFDVQRNRLGGLLLLQSGLNQSLGDKTYEEKRTAYVAHGQNLLAASLHPDCYASNPDFNRLINETKLQFQHYDSFGIDEQQERQELYIRIAEWVWNPSRLALDHDRPPVHEEIAEVDASANGGSRRTSSGDSKFRFWQTLLPLAHASSDLHSKCTPRDDRYMGVKANAHSFNYVVMASETRVELDIYLADAAQSKRSYDALVPHRAAIEQAYGGALVWDRREGNISGRISVTFPAGWVDEHQWEATSEAAVDAMNRLYAAVIPYVQAFEA